MTDVEDILCSLRFATAADGTGRFSGMLCWQGVPFKMTVHALVRSKCGGEPKRATAPQSSA